MRTFLFFCLLIVYLTSCENKETFPDEPHISFKSILLKDSIEEKLGNPIKHALIDIYVIDGDGNIGLKEKDTNGVFSPDSLYYSNVFISFFKKKNKEYIMMEEKFYFRTPYIEPKGKNKALKADFLIELSLNNNILKAKEIDTARYEIFIVDRDFNISNTIITPDIPFNKPGKIVIKP